jgi:hypothetical protein
VLAATGIMSTQIMNKSVIKVFNTLKRVARTCIIVYEKYPTETKTVNKKHKIKIMKKRVHSLHYLSITRKRLL